MNFENMAPKDLNELERLTRELLVQIRKSKLQDEALVEALNAFERNLGEARRERFDATNNGYRGY